MHDIESRALAELIDKTYSHSHRMEILMATTAEALTQLATSVANLQARESTRDQTIAELRAQVDTLTASNATLTAADATAGDTIAAHATQIDAINP